MSDIHPLSITDIPEDATESLTESKTAEEPKEEVISGNTEYTQGNSYGYDTFPEWTKVRN